jgi:hypothetical protein
MTAYGFDNSAKSRATWPPTRRWWDNYVMRGLRRSLIGSAAAVPMIVAVIVAQDVPAGGNRTLPLLIAAGAALLPVFTWRWFGKGRGVLWGCWLWLLSYGFFSGIMAAASVTVQLVAWAGGAPVDEDDMLATAIISVVVFVLCGLGLKRSDPDD